VERALAAAQASLQAGAFDAARGMLTLAETAPLDAFQRARVGLLQGQVAFAEGLGTDAPPLLLAAARQLEALDLDLARETYLNACGAAMFAGPAERRSPAGRLPRRPGPAASDGHAEGRRHPAGRGRAAHHRRSPGRGPDAPARRERLLRRRRPRGGLPSLELVRHCGQQRLVDDDGLRSVCARQIQLARDAGALGGLPMHLLALSTAAARSGDMPAASSLMAEAEAIAEATGTRFAPYTQLVVLALRGDEADAVALVESTIARAADLRQSQAPTVAHWAASVLYNGLGRYEDARRAAAAASSAQLDMFAGMWSLPELVEAAARTGAAELARDAVVRLEATTRPAGTDFGRGVEARCRALVSERDEAEGFFREAIERLGRTRLRVDLARAHLLYGEWLRREGRRRDAREQLRAAHGMLVGMGLAAFGERARRELVATGEVVRRRRTESRDELSAQEREIARLAGDGLSNPEIGARLFLSPRTVEWHLRKVFTKLGIRSRQELAGVARD
jgi:DNA-binding CsgD family transcriptional regulator